jgi:hypothetical protein
MRGHCAMVSGEPTQRARNLLADDDGRVDCGGRRIGFLLQPRRVARHSKAYLRYAAQTRLVCLLVGRLRQPPCPRVSSSSEFRPRNQRIHLTVLFEMILGALDDVHSYLPR